MTTTDLVPVFAGTLAGTPAQLCNARDLHAALGVGRDFATWIKERIAEYGFAEAEDFVTVTAPPIRGAGNRGKRIDYHLALDMAKELAMIENNEIGRNIRRYLIALEKQARQQPTPPALPAPETEIDRQKRSRINRRAYELSHRAYETYRDQMMTCHFITRGQIAIEQWLPPHLTENVISDAESLSKVCRIFADQLAQNASDLARLAGIER